MSAALDRDWPGLRADVQVHPVQPGGDGRAAWVVEDPVGGMGVHVLTPALIGRRSTRCAAG